MSRARLRRIPPHGASERRSDLGRDNHQGNFTMRWLREMKYCPRCKRWLNEEAFGKHIQEKDNHRRYCIKCYREYMRNYKRQWRQTPKNLIKEKIFTDNWKNANGAKWWAIYQLNRAIKKGLIYDGPRICELCGKKLSSDNFVRHHDNYGRPFEFRILCKKCHGEVHHAAIPLVPGKRSWPTFAHLF